MYNNSARSAEVRRSQRRTRQLLPKWSEMKRGLNTTEGPNSSPPSSSKHPKRQKLLQQQQKPQEEENYVNDLNNDLEVIEASSTFKRPQNSSEELFNYWRNFLIRDSFTDLKVICKNDYDCNGISLHKAILASCSKFLSSILLDGRDETTVFLPEVDKEDFHNLVRNLYGEKGTKRPSQELLTLLQISKLPEIGEDSASTTLTTCIEPEPSDTSFEATDLPIENSSQEQQQSQEILEDDPACSVGEPQKEIEQPATNEETPQKTVDESSSVSTVQSNHDNCASERPKQTTGLPPIKITIGLEKLSSTLVDQLKKGPPSNKARGRLLTRRQSCRSPSSSSSSSSSSSRSSSSSSDSSSGSSSSDSSDDSSRSSSPDKSKSSLCRRSSSVKSNKQNKSEICKQIATENATNSKDIIKARTRLEVRSKPRYNTRSRSRFRSSRSKSRSSSNSRSNSRPKLRSSSRPKSRSNSRNNPKSQQQKPIDSRPKLSRNNINNKRTRSKSNSSSTSRSRSRSGARIWIPNAENTNKGPPKNNNSKKKTTSLLNQLFSDNEEENNQEQNSSSNNNSKQLATTSSDKSKQTPTTADSDDSGDDDTRSVISVMSAASSMHLVLEDSRPNTPKDSTQNNENGTNQEDVKQTDNDDIQSADHCDSNNTPKSTLTGSPKSSPRNTTKSTPKGSTKGTPKVTPRREVIGNKTTTDNTNVIHNNWESSSKQTAEISCESDQSYDVPIPNVPSSSNNSDTEQNALTIDSGDDHDEIFTNQPDHLAPAKVPRHDQILLNTPRRNLDLPPTPGRSWSGILEQSQQSQSQNNFIHHHQAKPVVEVISNELVVENSRHNLPSLSAWNSNYLDPYTTNLGGGSESSGAHTKGGVGNTPTPFQTPPLSVGSSGSVHSIDPERIQFNVLDHHDPSSGITSGLTGSSMTPPVDVEMPEVLPIAPPDLFSDNYVHQAEDNNVNTGNKNNLFPVPPTSLAAASRDEDCWSDAERSEWSDACWSDDESTSSVRLSSTTKPPTPGRRTPLYPGRLTPGRMTPKFTRIFEQIPFQGSRDPPHAGSTNLGIFTPPPSASPRISTPRLGASPNPNLNSNPNSNPRNHNDPNPRNHNDIPMTPRSQEISNILNDLLEMPNPPNY